MSLRQHPAVQDVLAFLNAVHSWGGPWTTRARRWQDKLEGAPPTGIFDVLPDSAELYEEIERWSEEIWRAAWRGRPPPALTEEQVIDVTPDRLVVHAEDNDPVQVVRIAVQTRFDWTAHARRALLNTAARTNCQATSLRPGGPTELLEWGQPLPQHDWLTDRPLRFRLRVTAAVVAEPEATDPHISGDPIVASVLTPGFAPPLPPASDGPPPSPLDASMIARWARQALRGALTEQVALPAIDDPSVMLGDIFTRGHGHHGSETPAAITLRLCSFARAVACVPPVADAPSLGARGRPTVPRKAPIKLLIRWVPKFHLCKAAGVKTLLRSYATLDIEAAVEAAKAAARPPRKEAAAYTIGTIAGSAPTPGHPCAPGAEAGFRPHGAHAGPDADLTSDE